MRPYDYRSPSESGSTAVDRVSLVFFLAALSVFSACGPKAVIHPDFNPRVTRLVAVLPLKEEGAIARERSRAIQRELVSELRNSGFVVLEPQLIEASNPDGADNNYRQLSKRYGVGILAQLEVASLSENDFFLGYYNTLAGSLRLHQPSGAVMVEVEHRESQRGGLLFQSGQIVQGLREQFANARGENSELLVSRFVRRVVRELPAVQGRDSDIEVLQAIVAPPEVKLLSGHVAHICVDGTMDSMATVTFDKQTSSLREVQPGRYCTILRVKEFLERGSEAHIELRTPFGSSRREVFSLSMYMLR